LILSNYSLFLCFFLDNQKFKNQLERNKKLYKEVKALLWLMGKRKVDRRKAFRLLESECAIQEDAVLEGYKAIVLHDPPFVSSLHAERQ